MKYSLLIFICFLTSCVQNYSNLEFNKNFYSKGFAFIYNEVDYEKKIIKKKLDNNTLQIAHSNIRPGALIKIINLKTNDSIVLKNNKRVQYRDFYKILITEPVAKKLNLSKNLPIVEIIEVKKNKSFVAKKAKIFQEEKKISSNAPVTSVQIANISKKVQYKKKKNTENIYILIASFYTNDAANILKKRIINETPEYDNKRLYIKKKSDKEFEVLSGPYKSINLLKNDYIIFKNFGFEEMDIFINE